VVGSGKINLQVLHITFPAATVDCSGYSQLIGNMKLPQLKSLRLKRWPDAELPCTVFQAQSLQYLDLEGSSSLERLPQGLAKLTDIRWLNFSGCRGLLELPEHIADLQRLQRLDADGCCSLKRLPHSLGRLHGLLSLVSQTAVVYRSCQSQ
jgi:Leucine-rich repeat (LRR) protein